MPSPSGNPEPDPSIEASSRFAAGGNGQDVPMATGSFGPGLSAVAAHALLNSASVVMVGAATLEADWEILSDDERHDILDRVRRHATHLSGTLAELVQPGAV